MRILIFIAALLALLSLTSCDTPNGHPTCKDYRLAFDDCLYYINPLKP